MRFIRNTQLINTLTAAMMCVAACAYSTVGVAQVTVSDTFDNPRYCPPYTDSVLHRERRQVARVHSGSDWESVVESATPGTEVLFADGVYRLNRNLVKIGTDVTLRSLSGNADRVVIKGPGYKHKSQGLVIAGDRVTIADLTVTAMRDHGIYVKPELGGGFGPVIYNVHVFDIGTQHIKSNTGSLGGMIACSAIGYSERGARGDYNGAIDLHGADAWNIRDNKIYNIAGDGSGCNVSKHCGRYVSSPAILVWNQSSDTVVERNTITQSYRNIAFGLGRGHRGGVIRDNTIIRTARGDAGIELQGADGTLVENNTVLLHDRYRGAIEYRDSKNIVVRNNRVSSRPWNRGNNVNATATGNSIVRLQ